MKNDKQIIYLIELALVIFFLLIIFFSNIFTKPLIAIILLVFMIISIKLIKSDQLPDINHKKVTFLMMVFGILYLAILYLLGGNQGFYNAPIKLSVSSLINFTIPYIVIIISLEIIRKKILLKENKRHNIIILIIMVMLDIVIVRNLQTVRTLNDYYVLIGFIAFSSIINNILYNDIVIKNKSSKPTIFYRIITTIYIYILPIIPDINIFIESMTRIIVPYLIYLILNLIYTKEQKIMPIKSKKSEIIISTISCIIVGILVILVSCQFRYCALVIGSGSMTGTINKGDVIIYETYKKGQVLEENEIIVFNSDGRRVVHRIIDKRDSIKGMQYYTKGDANQNHDIGYRQEEDILGVVKFRVPQIGQITLFIRELFE